MAEVAMMGERKARTKAIDEEYRRQQAELQGVYTAEAIERAILTMYDGTSADAVRRSSDEFLQEFLAAGSNVVLAPCAALLGTWASSSSSSSSSLSTAKTTAGAVQVFAAHALHRTVQHCVIVAEARQRSHVTFDEGEWGALRGTLVDLVRAFAAVRPVLTQLAQALGALALKMPSWDPARVVGDVVRCLDGVPTATVEVLGSLVDELDDPRTKMHPDLRLAHEAAQAAAAPVALAAIAAAAQARHVDPHVALDAAAPWLAKMTTTTTTTKTTTTTTGRPGEEERAALYFFDAFVAAACDALAAADADLHVEAAANALTAAITSAMDVTAVATHGGLLALLLGGGHDDGGALPRRARDLTASIFALLAKRGHLEALHVLVEAHKRRGLEPGLSYALADVFQALGGKDEDGARKKDTKTAGGEAAGLTNKEDEEETLVVVIGGGGSVASSRAEVVGSLAAIFAASLASQPTALCYEADVDGEDRDRSAERDVLIDALRDAMTCAGAPSVDAVGAVVCAALRRPDLMAAASLACARTVFKVVVDSEGGRRALVAATLEACVRCARLPWAQGGDERAAVVACAAISAMALSQKNKQTTKARSSADDDEAPRAFADVAAHFATRSRPVEARAGLVALMHVCDATEDAVAVRPALEAAALPIFEAGLAGTLAEAPLRDGKESLRLIALRCLARHSTPALLFPRIARGVDTCLAALVAAENRNKTTLDVCDDDDNNNKDVDGSSEAAAKLEASLLDAAVAASAARRDGRLFADTESAEAAALLCGLCVSSLVRASSVARKKKTDDDDDDDAGARPSGRAAAGRRLVVVAVVFPEPDYAAAHALFALLAPGWKDGARKRFAEGLAHVAADVTPLHDGEFRGLDVAADAVAAVFADEHHHHQHHHHQHHHHQGSRKIGAAALVGHLVTATAQSPRPMAPPHRAALATKALALVEGLFHVAHAAGGSQILRDDAPAIVDFVRAALGLGARDRPRTPWLATAERAALDLASTLLQGGLSGDTAVSTIALASEVAALTEDGAVRVTAIKTLVAAGLNAWVPSGCIVELSEALLRCATAQPTGVFEADLASALADLSFKHALPEAVSIAAASRLAPEAAFKALKKQLKALCGGKRKGEKAPGAQR